MPNYIHLDFEDARLAKWAHGVREYRKTPDEPFNGNHCEEAFQECLDLYNLLEDMEKKFGINLQIPKSMAYQIGATLKAQHRRLAGR